MSLKREQINSIAHLARLSLTEAEVPVYQDSLSKIVDLIGSMPGLAQRLRPDVVTEKDQHELYQRNAPQVEAALYLVPKVIE
jgi:aspartyl-tRNA(Asn)/glutamyl-tRNA(Gln) amidotransferase subunit C